MLDEVLKMYKTASENQIGNSSNEQGPLSNRRKPDYQVDPLGNPIDPSSIVDSQAIGENLRTFQSPQPQYKKL